MHICVRNEGLGPSNAFRLARNAQLQDWDSKSGMFVLFLNTFVFMSLGLQILYLRLHIRTCIYMYI